MAMSSPLELIGTAWSFYKKQPVLNEIAFWLFFLPFATLDTLTGVAETVAAQGMDETISFPMTPIDWVIVLPLLFVVFYCIFWGQSCVLVVTKRMLISAAGRSRTSFKAVRKEAKKYIAALFLTELLRGAITLLWSLLLIVPGVIYSARTMFYDIMMVEDGKVQYGRPILNKSKALVTGKTWDVFWRLVIIAICVFGPAAMVDVGISSSLTAIDERLSTLALVLADLVDSFAGVFFIVCAVALYADLKESVR